MAKKSTAGYDPRKIWSTNLAPLVTAAREGAARAADTASKERARARRKPQWWQQRWLVVTAAALAVAGASGGVYAAVAKRRTAAGPEGPEGAAGAAASPEHRAGTPAQAIMSTVENGREKVAEAARIMRHKLRRDGPDETAPTRFDPVRPAIPLGGGAPDGSRNQAGATSR